MAKDETEVGITGKPVPKPTTAKQQHELEKKRRMRKHLGRNVGGTQYSSDVNPYLNPRSVREEVLVDYLLDEGFASDEKSASAIASAMSEEWKQSIVEGKSYRPLGLMHPFARGMKQKKGGKSEEKYGQDSEGNPTGKYSEMQHQKRQAQREKDSDEQRRRDRGAMSRGTWDKD